jgi:hypothetical protein
MASAVAAGWVGDSDKPPSSFVGFGWFGRIVHAAGSGRRGHSKIFSSLLAAYAHPRGPS